MSGTPDREEIDAKIAAAVAPIVAEQKWHKWLLFAIFAATISPKLGGPAAPDVVATIFDHAAQGAGVDR